MKKENLRLCEGLFNSAEKGGFVELDSEMVLAKGRHLCLLPLEGLFLMTDLHEGTEPSAVSSAEELCENLTELGFFD